jgi:hypothetical protein
VIIFLQCNPLFGLHIDKQNDIKDEYGFNEYTQLTEDDTHKHEDELDEVPIIEKVVDKCEEAIRIVRPWEELQIKQNRYGLGYNKVHDSLFIPDYCKHVHFISGGFLNDDRKKS